MDILSKIEKFRANQLEDKAWRILCDHKEKQPETSLKILIPLRLRLKLFLKELSTIQIKKVPE